MLTIRPRQRATNSSESSRIYPASAIDLDARVAQRGVERGFVGGLADPLGRQREGRRCRARAPRRGRGHRACPRRRARRRSIARLLDERHHVRAAARDQNADLGSRFPHACGVLRRRACACRRPWTSPAFAREEDRLHASCVARPVGARAPRLGRAANRAATLAPPRSRRSRNTVSPAASSAASPSPPRSAATTTAMPIPQLNVRAISSGSIAPCACRNAISRGCAQASASIRACAPSGSTRGIFSSNPPPVMCASPLIRPSREQRQQRSSRRSASAPSARRSAARSLIEQRRPVELPALVRRQPPDQRKAVRMHARRSEAEDHVARRDVAARSAPGRARPRRRRSRPGRNRPRAYMPGISAVSPPISAQPAWRQPSAIDGDHALGDRRCRACRSRNNRGRTAARRPARSDRWRTSRRGRCRPRHAGRCSIASFSLVPTPSFAATSSGSTNPAAFRSKKPPNPPSSASAPGRRVALASGPIARTSALPAAIETPASA